jgi:hypothetical protein
MEQNLENIFPKPMKEILFKTSGVILKGHSVEHTRNVFILALCILKIH